MSEFKLEYLFRCSICDSPLNIENLEHSKSGEQITLKVYPCEYCLTKNQKFIKAFAKSH